MKKIKVGTIGYGGAFNMGKAHLDGLLANEGFEAHAVCDIDPSRLETAKEDFPGIETYTDLDDMLNKSDVELLVVILPHNVHGDISVKCLNAGRHVVVEKPFAVTVNECDAMIEAARANNVMVTTYHNRHWDPTPLLMLEHLPRIGRAFRWESHWGGYNEPRDWWRSKKDISGGIMYDWGAHIIEWMLQVMSYDMTEISGSSIKEVWTHTNEDDAQAIVRFGDKGVGTHTTSDITMAGPRDSIRIVGTEGAITMQGHTNGILYSLDERGKQEQTYIHRKNGEQHKFYANVAAHLHHGEDLVITPEWARRVIQVMDYADQSAKKGEAMKPKYK